MALWTNGPARPPPQTSQTVAQFSHNSMRNQQPRNASLLCQYLTANTGFRPQQSANFTYHNGAHPNRQPSNWQTSSVSSSQQPSRETLNHHQLLLKGKVGQLSSTDTQSGNPSLPYTYGLQNPAQTFYSQSPTNSATVKTSLAHWNQTVRVHGSQSLRIQEGNMPVQNGVFHNINGNSTKPVSATLPSYQQMAYTRKEVPAAAPNLKAAYNDNQIQNGTQHGFAPSEPLPNYSTAVNQSSYKVDIIKTNPSSSGQNLSSTSPNTLHCYSMNSNSYDGQHERSNQQVNPQVEAPEEMQRCIAIATIEQFLRDLQPVGSENRPPVYTSSHNVGMQANQYMQPMAPESYNSNNSQSLPINSGQFLPKTINSLVSAQHTVNVPPQQSTVPNIYVTGDGSGNGSKGANAFFPKNNVRSLSDTAQLIQLPEGISPQRNETQPPVAGSRERIEMHPSVKVNDCSMQSSPGRTRAVAVVQPLSHDSFQVASKQTCSNTISQSTEGIATDESLSNPKECHISPKKKERTVGSVSLENQNQMSPDKSENGYSEVSNNGTLLPSLDSAGSGFKKQLCTYEAGSELTTDMQVEQHVAPTAQQSVTSELLVTQNNDKEKEYPKELFELSSLPTVGWTHAKLTRLIKKVENAQEKAPLKDSTKPHPITQMLSMFWDGSLEKFQAELKTGLYKKLVCDASEFQRNHTTPDSVVLSHIKYKLWWQVKRYHVLKHDEVYSELPYKSSWLNVNLQLDDIDKEFDFPPSLKHHLHTLESGSEVSDELLSSTELEPLVLSEEEEDSTASPSKMESDDSSDPYYSFEIQVLPPEEAKVIFEQSKSKLPQSMEKDNQPQKVTKSSVEDELSKIIDTSLSEKEPKNKPASQIEQVCCISKWIEMISGSLPESLSKCKCKTKQSHKNITDKTLVCAIRSDGQLYSATNGDNQANSREKFDKQVVTLGWSEQCSELSDVIDLTENDDNPHSDSDKEPEDISHMSISSCQSSTTLTCENKDDLFGSEKEMFCQMPDFMSDSEKALVKVTESSQSCGSDETETKTLSRSDTEIRPDPEVDNVQDQLASTGNAQSYTSVTRDTEMESLFSSENEVARQMSDLEEKCRQAQLTYKNKSSLETEEITQSIVTGALQTACTGNNETVERNRKRQRSPDRFPEFFNKPKKSKSFEGNSQSGKFFSATPARTADLVLFGSTPKAKCVSVSSWKSDVSSPEGVSYAVTRPPTVLTVNLSPLKIKYNETGESSVKHKIYEKWSRSFQPTKMRRKNKLKTKKCAYGSLSGWRHKNDMTVSSEMKILDGQPKFCLNLKRRRSVIDEHKHKEEAKRTTLIQSADQERRQADSGSDAAVPLQSKDVLKFSVLPNTFDFQDGSFRKKKPTHPVPYKPDPVGKKDQRHRPIVSTRGIWFPNPEKKYRPLSPAVPKTSSLFNEYQKKYKKKTVPYMDE
ncbi:uncharacterized protein si:ch211-106e7.2 [Centropristis striata]|uniref:uncharacterized protein si:ch211-106e7.2 n=1 Tax=Centropristis striata TaxID=184440 RepID=UPI0027DF9808|nr:uncharacterized protein si:ch211-106e7.2 [Centropristis striata]